MGRLHPLATNASPTPNPSEARQGTAHEPDRIQSHARAADNPHMNTPHRRPNTDAGHQEDVLLILPLMIVGLLLAWAAMKYGWL